MLYTCQCAAVKVSSIAHIAPLLLLGCKLNIVVNITGTSIRLSPLGIVSACPGGQILLTCERTSGLFLHWTVSVPHLVPRETIVGNQGAFITDLQLTGLHYATFTITRTSINPLTSQMMVNNVTTEINGSTIYCSQDGNENGAPMVTITVTNEGINYYSSDFFFNFFSDAL